MKLIDIEDRPFWRLSNGELNRLAFHMVPWHHDFKGFMAIECLMCDLEDEIAERNQL